MACFTKLILRTQDRLAIQGYKHPQVFGSHLNRAESAKARSSTFPRMTVLREQAAFKQLEIILPQHEHSTTLPTEIRSRN